VAGSSKGLIGRHGIGQVRRWYLDCLDHLRRQAKDLLAVLRRAQPSATLADAQTSVAHDYGCERWTQLQAAPTSSAPHPESARQARTCVV